MAMPNENKANFIMNDDPAVPDTLNLNYENHELLQVLRVGVNVGVFIVAVIVIVVVFGIALVDF